MGTRCWGRWSCLAVFGRDPCRHPGFWQHNPPQPLPPVPLRCVLPLAGALWLLFPVALQSPFQGVRWVKASKVSHRESSITDLPSHAPPDLVPSDLPEARPSDFVIGISSLIYSPSLVRRRRADYFLKGPLALHSFLKLGSVHLAACARGQLCSGVQSEILTRSASDQPPPPPWLALCPAMPSTPGRISV